MADFIIPQGEEFKFTMKVITNDSFLPQSVADLVDIGVAGSATKVKIQNRDTLACLVSTGVTIEKIPDDVEAVPLTYLNGMLSVTLPSTLTAQMVSDRADKIDDYYLKPTYQILITLDFNDVYPTRTAMIKDVFVLPTTCGA